MKIVRLLRGHCTTLEGFVMNDFEAMPVADTNTLFGETFNQGCRFNAVIFQIRPQPGGEPPPPEPELVPEP
jgi:hypothetical protein